MNLKSIGLMAALATNMLLMTGCNKDQQKGEIVAMTSSCTNDDTLRIIYQKENTNDADTILAISGAVLDDGSINFASYPVAGKDTTLQMYTVQSGDLYLTGSTALTQGRCAKNLDFGVNLEVFDPRKHGSQNYDCDFFKPAQ